MSRLPFLLWLVISIPITCLSNSKFRACGLTQPYVATVKALGAFLVWYHLRPQVTCLLSVLPWSQAPSIAQGLGNDFLCTASIHLIIISPLRAQLQHLFLRKLLRTTHTSTLTFTLTMGSFSYLSPPTLWQLFTLKFYLHGYYAINLSHKNEHTHRNLWAEPLSGLPINIHSNRWH